MAKKVEILTVLLLMILFLSPVQSIQNDSDFIDIKKTDLHEKLLVGGWVEEREGITIPHVNGKNYQMGYQHGSLLKEKISQNYRALFSLDDENRTNYSRALEIWHKKMKDNISIEYKEELQGLADGSESDINDTIVFNIGLSGFLMGWEECMEMSAWGNATADGELIHFRSWDIPSIAVDPKTDIPMEENQVLIVREPQGGYASVFPVLAGGIFCRGGMNEKGIVVSSEASYTPDFTYNATWFACRKLMVLDNASNASEAIAIMNSSRNGCINFVISDGNTPEAFVCEETSNMTYVGTWDNEAESRSPFWQIEQVVRRKNFFIHPDLAKTQRPFYSPRIFPILTFFKTRHMFFTSWRYYKTLSEEIEERWGKLDVNLTFSMARLIYRGETDWFLKLCGLAGWESFSAFHQWIAYPKAGDFAFSFADREQKAQYNTIHYVNLYNLLEEEPP